MSWLDRLRRSYETYKQERLIKGALDCVEAHRATKPPLQSAAALPRNLEWLMADRGLTPVQLADKAHISASNIRHLLRGTGYERGTPEASPNPTLTTLLAVAEALGVGIEDLVEGREP